MHTVQEAKVYLVKKRKYLKENSDSLFTKNGPYAHKNGGILKLAENIGMDAARFDSTAQKLIEMYGWNWTGTCAPNQHTTEFEWIQAFDKGLRKAYEEMKNNGVAYADILNT